MFVPGLVGREKRAKGVLGEPVLPFAARYLPELGSAGGEWPGVGSNYTFYRLLVLRCKALIIRDLTACAKARFGCFTDKCRRGLQLRPTIHFVC